MLRLFMMSLSLGILGSNLRAFAAPPAARPVHDSASPTITFRVPNISGTPSSPGAHAVPQEPSLSPVPSRKTPKNLKTVDVYFPKDRCKSGRIVFYGRSRTNPQQKIPYECPVMGRGSTVYGTRPPVPANQISNVSENKDTTWLCGKTDTNQDCCYLNPNKTNGATPAPKSGFQFWLDGKRDNATSYGNLNLSCLDFVNPRAENPGKRSLLRLHGGRETLKFSQRNSHGCLRMDPACQAFFNEQLEEITGRTPDCGTKPHTNRINTLMIHEGT